MIVQITGPEGRVIPLWDLPGATRTARRVPANVQRYIIAESLRRSNLLFYSDEYIHSKVVPSIQQAFTLMKALGITPESVDMDKALEFQLAMKRERESVTAEEKEAFLRGFISLYRDYVGAITGLSVYADAWDALLLHRSFIYLNPLGRLVSRGSTGPGSQVSLNFFSRAEYGGGDSGVIVSLHHGALEDLASAPPSPVGYSTARREVVLQLRRLLGRDEGERTVLDLDELLGTRGQGMNPSEVEQGIHGVLERARRIGGPYEAAATVIGGLIEEASTAGLELDLLTYISVGSPTSLNGLRLFDMCTCPPSGAPTVGMNIQSVLVSDALNSVLFAMGYGEWPAVSSEVLRAISQSANRAVPAQRQGQVSLPVIGRQGMESLVQRARAFFERKTTLSYTLLEATEDPYLFFKRYVLKMDTGNQATRMGERVHRRAEALFRGEAVSEPEGIEAYILRNTVSVIEYLESMGFRQVSAEQRVLGPLEAVLGTGQGMDIEGRIDAVFSDGHNYLILDYKTDRTQERWHRHRVQLELYRDLFSMNSSVSKDRVFTGLAYVSLRGTVNTGRIWPELMVLEQDEGVKAILRRALERYLFWKEDPERLLLDIGRQRPVREGLHAALVASMQLR